MRIYVTNEGLEKLKKDLAEMTSRLETVKREKAIAYTASGDTWHDNPHFNKLQQDEEGIAKRVAEMQEVVTRAEVVYIPNRNTRQVRLGSIVRFYRRRSGSNENNIETWEIVGYGETDTEARKVAYNAPLAAALLGLAPGDISEGEAADGHVEYEVIRLYDNWESVPAE
jgi:transcription elongation factor GreA